MLCVLTAPPTCHSPSLLTSLGPPFPLRHINIDIRPVNHKVAFMCSSECKSCPCLTLNQKLEMIALREEVMLKSQDRLKTRPLAPVIQVANVKGKFLKEIKSVNSSEHLNGKPYCWYRESCIMVWLEDQSSHSISLSQILIQSKAPTLSNSLEAERWGRCRRKV